MWGYRGTFMSVEIAIISIMMKKSYWFFKISLIWEDNVWQIQASTCHSVVLLIFEPKGLDWQLSTYFLSLHPIIIHYAVMKIVPVTNTGCFMVHYLLTKNILYCSHCWMWCNCCVLPMSQVLFLPKASQKALSSSLIASGYSGAALKRALYRLSIIVGHILTFGLCCFASCRQSASTSSLSISLCFSVLVISLIKPTEVHTLTVICV